MYQALLTTGIKVKALKTQAHKFKYTHQIPIVGSTEMVEAVKDAKVIWFTMGNIKLAKVLQPHLKNKRVVVTHTGTTYRQNARVNNELFNQFTHKHIMLGHDHMVLGAHNPHYNSCRVIDLKAMQPRYHNRKIPVVAHYPSQPEKKGTSTINQAIDELLKEGLAFEKRVSVDLVPHDENIRRMRDSDIYIEQFLQYQGAVRYGEIGNQAYEAAALGNIVISNLLETKHYEQKHGKTEIEIANNKEELKQKIKQAVLLSPAERTKRQKKIREWIKNTHSLDAMGKSLLTDVSEEIQKADEKIFHQASLLRASQKIDVVYLLGKGSRWDNNEIRFSLRSIEKNLKQRGRVFIVGENPGFTKNVTLLPCPDKFSTNNADGNMIHKVLRACQERELSDNFLLIADDHFITKPIAATKMPPLYKCDLNDLENPYFTGHNVWRKRLKKTRDILNQTGLPTNHYDIHSPMVINKREFINIMKRFDYSSDIGLNIKSIYCNAKKTKGVLNEGHRVEIFSNLKTSQIYISTADAFIVATNDKGLNQSMKYWLISNFPNQSRYEASLPEDIILDIGSWLMNGQDYDRGVEIFAKYIKHRRLVQLLTTGWTPQLENKLKYKLQRIIDVL